MQTIKSGLLVSDTEQANRQCLLPTNWEYMPDNKREILAEHPEHYSTSAVDSDSDWTHIIRRKIDLS